MKSDILEQIGWQNIVAEDMAEGADVKSFWLSVVMSAYQLPTVSNWIIGAIEGYYDEGDDGDYSIPFTTLIPTTNTKEAGKYRQSFIAFLKQTFPEMSIGEMVKDLTLGKDFDTVLFNGTNKPLSEVLNKYYLALISGSLMPLKTADLYQRIIGGDQKYAEFGIKSTLREPDFNQLSTEEAFKPIALINESVVLPANGMKVICLPVETILQDIFNENTQVIVEGTNGIYTNLIRFKGEEVVVEIRTGGINRVEEIESYIDQGWQYLVLLVNNSTKEVTANFTTTATLIPVISELEGQWSKGDMVINEIEISDQAVVFLTLFGKDMLASIILEGEPLTADRLDELAGAVFDIEMAIKPDEVYDGKVAYNQLGALIGVDEIPFEYDKGYLTGQVLETDIEMSLEGKAYYSGDSTVGLWLQLDINYRKEMILMDTVLSGNKSY